MLQIKNKIALITGSSRGIGAATALLLAENGYDIAVNYLQNDKKAEKIVNIAKKFNVKAIAIKADLENENEIIQMFKKIDQELGSIDVLVNNGGISGGIFGIEEINFKILEQVYRTNVFSSFICSREAIKRMKQSKGGSIINISSLAAKMGGFKMTAYASSKAAIENFTIGLSREVAEFNIRVNAVQPGVIDTDTHLRISEDRKSHLKNSIPLRRMGTPQEVAEAVLWLASHKSSYVTGSVLTVSGGK